MKKIISFIKVALVVLAFGTLSIQAERRGYLDGLLLKDPVPLTKNKKKLSIKKAKEKILKNSIPHTKSVQIVTDSINDPVACDKIKITRTNQLIKINNENDQKVVVHYSIYENDQKIKEGNLMVDASTSVDFNESVPNKGKVVFSMGADNIQNNTVITGDFCAVKTGTKIVEVGERIDTIQVYEGKAYDARDLSWFVFKERQRLKDLNGNTVEESDKGVSLKDLTTIADETNLRVDFQAGRIGYTDAIVWFKIENDLPTAPQLLTNNLTSLSTAIGTVNGTIPAGTRMGFVLIGDVAAKNPIVQNPQAQLRFEGTQLQYSTDNGTIWNTIPEHQLVYSIKDWNKNQHESVVAGISDHPTVAGDKVLTLVFEDIAGGYGDLDYEDVRCTVYLKGVTKLKTKIIKETKEVDVYTGIPCGDCEVTILGGDNNPKVNGCTDSTYYYSMSGTALVINANLFTFDKDAYLNIKKDRSSAHLYGFASTTINNETVRYLIDFTFNNRSDLYFPIDGNKSTILSENGTSLYKINESDVNFLAITNSDINDPKISIIINLDWEEISTQQTGNTLVVGDIRNYCPEISSQCPPDAFRHQVSNAVSDEAHDSNDNYGIQMKDLFTQGETALFSFDNNQAYMDISKGGSAARFLGYTTLINSKDNSAGVRYFIDIKFERAKQPVTAQKELKPGYQTDDIIKDWRFFRMKEAIITNMNTRQDIKFTQTPTNDNQSLQVGYTANGKNVHYGASAKFQWEEAGRTGQGSLHIDLKNLCPPSLPNLCEPPVEVIYVLDQSGSMNSSYTQTGNNNQTMTRLRAAQNALIYANNTLDKQGVLSRSALVVFNDKSAKLVTSYTNDFNELNALTEEIGSPSAATPMAQAMRLTKDVLKSHDPKKRPIIVLISDGVPTVDLNNQYYDDKEVTKIKLFNPATQTYRSKEEVAQMGGVNVHHVGANPTQNGQVLAEVMDMFEQIQAQTPNVLIYGLGIEQSSQGNDSFSSDLLEYAAYKTGAKYYSVENAQGMINSVTDILVDATCNHTTTNAQSLAIKNMYEENIKIGPNPAHDYVNIDLSSLFIQSKKINVNKVNVKLSDAKGQLLKEQTLDNHHNLGKVIRFALPAKNKHQMLIITCIVEHTNASGSSGISKVVKKIIVN